MSLASQNSSWVTTDMACTAAAWLGWMTVLPVSPFALSRCTSRIRPSRSSVISCFRSMAAERRSKGDCRSCGLKIRSPAEKYSHTGPVTTKPVPSARPSTLTTSAMTPATGWMS
jgi:hypothetical protein